MSLDGNRDFFCDLTFFDKPLKAQSKYKLNPS